MDLFRNYTIISIGYNCSIKMYIKSIIDQETHLFDWIGTSMWGVNKFINNNFDLFNKNDFDSISLFIGDTPDKNMFGNKKYNFRFIHDLPNGMTFDKTLIQKNSNGQIIKINYYDAFKTKYERRITRFKELLESTKSIVFIRLEEVMTNRIIHDVYKNDYSKPEIQHIKEFINIISNKYPKLKFKVIFISTSNQTEVCDNLLILHNTNYPDKLINLSINQYSELIKQFLG